MTTIQGENELAENAPDKALLCSLALLLKILNDSSEVTIATVFHVEMQVLASF